ncbi:MAG: HAD hydrolase family protein [Streptococcus sp.]
MATNKNYVFDIDGTILSETTHTIPKVQLKDYKSKEQGHLIFINTGRPFHQLMSVSRNCILMVMFVVVEHIFVIMMKCYFQKH